MPGNAEPLLALSKSSKAPEGMSVKTPRFPLRWWSISLASSILLGIGCVFIILVGVPHHRPAFVSQMFALAAPSAPVRAPTRAPTLAPINVQHWGDATCYTFTGGTCQVHECDPARNSTCEHGRCRCDHGCTDARGHCQSARPELVASNFTIKNRRWPNHYIYVPSLTSYLKTCSDCEPETFDLYKILGHATYSHDERDKYFLRPNNHPEYTVGVSSSGAAVYHADMWRSWKDKLPGAGPVDPNDMMISLCESVKPGAYKMEGPLQFAAYSYRGSYSIGARHPEEKDSMGSDDWVPDPPFAFNVPRCL